MVDIMSIHGRESQLKILRAVLGKDDTYLVPPSIFVWGLASTGKTCIINKVLVESGVTHVVRLSAAEIICGRRPFFETILRQINPALSSNIKSENLRIFVRNLGVVIEQLSARGKERIVILLDKADELRKEHADILDNFANLQELTQANICVIICSTLPLINFNNISNMLVLPTIFFPQYSKDELINIITNCHPPYLSSVPATDPEVYGFYVRMLISVFYQRCRDIRKLLRLTFTNWEYFKSQCEVEGQNNLNKLWKKIEPRLKSDFQSLNSQLLRMPSLDSSRLQNNPGPTTSLKNNNEELSRHSKYLLVASYLATHNPPASDKRFFVKGSSGCGKKRNNAGNRSKGEESEGKSLRSFDQNRWKAIFAFLVRYCSTDENNEVYEDNVDLLVQITTLCQADFIKSLGEDSSGNFKYRCLVDYDFISEIARSINFELDRFLYRLV